MKYLVNKIHIGDCVKTMRDWPEKFVQTCVTSPPYYGLRDYGHDEQLGLEDTPEKYIANMVAVFREVKRVLKDDGTLWVNIGDSYASSTKGSGGASYKQDSNFGSRYAPRKFNHGVKEKDLIGIPWMLAFALRADGWYLRQDIIWHKPNPMPESVTDRCTKSHEYIFLLSKSQRYFFDCSSISEPALYFGKDPRSGTGNIRYEGKRTEGDPSANGQQSFVTINEKRNKRSVWTVNTKPYSGAHFAVYPEELIEPCILAGAKVGEIVLDPFMGSGTTAQVSEKLGRRWIGCELNPDYVELQNNRTAQMGMEFIA